MRWRDESGFVGGFEVLPFGFLVFVVGTLILVNAWAVFDCHLAASGAAREAVRVFVESDGTDGQAFADGQAAAAAAMEGQGKRDANRWKLTWSPDASLTRCLKVTATIDYRVPTVILPFFGSFGDALTTTARHTEIVDPYRAGLTTDGFDPDACHA